LVGAFWAFHISLGAMLRLGLFAPMAMAAWSALLPSAVWPARTEGGAVEVPAAPRATRVGWAVVAPLLALVVLANASYLWPRGMRLEPVGAAARALGLQQYWSVFSPPHWTQGALVDGWFSIEGNQPGGHSLELLTGGELAVTRPRMGSERFSNRRWRHWAAAMMEDWPRGSIQRRTVEDARQATLRWWCGDWNGRHGAGRVEVVRLVWMRQRLGHPEDVPERRVLAQGVCVPAPVAAVR
ncbi:MAG TPA: hypothetical protein VGF31_05265, partial [Myxococcaceae bacterium]